jgi:hypothetical protein
MNQVNKTKIPADYDTIAGVNAWENAQKKIVDHNPHIKHINYQSSDSAATGTRK